MRLLALIVAVLMILPEGTRAQNQPPETLPAPPPFADWLVALRQEARDRGFSDTLLDQTLDGVEPLEHVVQSDRSQAELNPGFRRYLSTRLTTAMIRRGKEKAAENRTVLGVGWDSAAVLLVYLGGMAVLYFMS